MPSVDAPGRSASRATQAAKVQRVSAHAVVVQRVARLPFQGDDGGASPTPRLHLTPASIGDVNSLLAAEHYLGPMTSGRHVFAGWVADELVAAQVWRGPTSRKLPSGRWLELSRWCLTPAAGKNAGSRMQAWVARWLRANTAATTLVSYSDPSQGHTGALYRACGWYWAPTWLRLRPPPSGHGDWGNGKRQAVKDRWVFDIRPDAERNAVLAVDDDAALRSYLNSDEWASSTHRWPSRLLVEAERRGLL